MSEYVVGAKAAVWHTGARIPSRVVTITKVGKASFETDDGEKWTMKGRRWGDSSSRSWTYQHCSALTDAQAEEYANAIEQMNVATRLSRVNWSKIELYKLREIESLVEAATAPTVAQRRVE